MSVIWVLRASAMAQSIKNNQLLFGAGGYFFEFRLRFFVVRAFAFPLQSTWGTPAFRIWDVFDKILGPFLTPSHFYQQDDLQNQQILGLVSFGIFCFHTNR